MLPPVACTNVPAFVTAPLKVIGCVGVTFTVAPAPIFSEPFTIVAPLALFTSTVALASTEIGIASDIVVP